MKHRLVLLFHLILTIFGFIYQVSAQDNKSESGSNTVHVVDIPALTLETLEKGIFLTGPWKYYPGDDMKWASPSFDDSEWESIDSTLSFLKGMSGNETGGIGWFRLHLSIPDERLWHMPLALNVVFQTGASEIYLDGKLIYKFGTVGTRKGEEEPYWERNPQGISFSGKTDHLIAVRYSNFSFYQIGFGLMIAPLDVSVETRVNMIRHGTTLQMVWTAITVFLMLQHLLLFIFYPRARENLYFAISTGSIGALVFLIFQFALLATGLTQTLSLLRLLVYIFVLMFVSAILFLYTLFYPKLPKFSWFLFIGWGATLCLDLFDLRFDIFKSLGLKSLLLILFTGITFFEMARVIIVAIFKKKDGAWIFGLGSLSPFIFTFVLGNLVSRIGYTINWQFGVLTVILAPLFSMSVYLARNYSRTSRKLEREVLERQVLEVENTRKTEELEAARKLQMSMLPQAAPQLPNLDIAFEMRPATEVGGDYYDYNLTEDGQLTIAIGDATGHGMNAGLVVSAVKSLFKTSAPEAGNLEMLERISQGIKSMNLKRLYMAMTLVTFNNNRLRLAAAGMPPALIYQADANIVEEVLLEGMPLGGFIGAERQEASYQLQSGDTVLLMSDGLPETLNRENEMLDYPKTKELFEEVADQSPKAIIDHLFKASTSWADGAPQADDVTLVTIKVK